MDAPGLVVHRLDYVQLPRRRSVRPPSSVVSSHSRQLSSLATWDVRIVPIASISLSSFDIAAESSPAVRRQRRASSRSGSETSSHASISSELCIAIFRGRFRSGPTVLCKGPRTRPLPNQRSGLPFQRFGLNPGSSPWDVATSTCDCTSDDASVARAWTRTSSPRSDADVRCVDVARVPRAVRGRRRPRRSASIEDGREGGPSTSRRRGNARDDGKRGRRQAEGVRRVAVRIRGGLQQDGTGASEGMRRRHATDERTKR